jgi:hypothetical protein
MTDSHGPPDEISLSAAISDSLDSTPRILAAKLSSGVNANPEASALECGSNFLNDFDVAQFTASYVGTGASSYGARYSNIRSVYNTANLFIIASETHSEREQNSNLTFI